MRRHFAPAGKPKGRVSSGGNKRMREGARFVVILAVLLVLAGALVLLVRVPRPAKTGAAVPVAAATMVPDTLRVSDDMLLLRLSAHIYVHISAAQIPSYGKVWSNGMLLVDNGEALLFDTPVDDAQTDTLVRWIADSLHVRITGFVPNHWHSDCMGGLGRLQRGGVPSYAGQMTVDIARKKGRPVPDHGFADSLTLSIGGTPVAGGSRGQSGSGGMQAHCYYLGGGHSTDNIVVWVPQEKVLFAGCMVKDLQARELGNLSDADVTAWPGTLECIQERFADVRTVIPGHGAVGGPELIEHTRGLLRQAR